ncbi:GntR family transcriptional regulator [Spirochaeta africana]|nr:GntR family transcriptional regulator [Spirochaeta africana]
MNAQSEKKYLKYRAVRDLLVRSLQDEQYQPGQKLPTELELTRKLNVSRTTIRQGLELLKEEGVVSKIQGSGTFFRGFDVKPGDTHQDMTSVTRVRKGFIGLVNFNYMDYIYPEIVRGAEEVLATEGYSLAIAPCNRDLDKEIQSIRRLIEQGVKGLIIEPSTNLQINEDHPISEVIRNIRIPVVATHWGITNQLVSTVSVDDVIAGRLAARHLLQQGHRDAAIIFKTDVQSGHDRLEGFRREMADAGYPVPDRMCAGFSNTEDEPGDKPGYTCTRQLLEQNQGRISAIFYFNDLTAQQGYQALYEAGLQIPQDISVIGFDNYQSTAFMNPPLTTFEHPKYDLGRWAARIVLDELSGTSYNLRKKLVFEPRLILRSSTGPVNTIRG